VLKYKARFVAKGYRQVYGRDYNETFSPTAKLSTIRMIVAIAAQYDANLHQLDVKTAYLNAPIDEDVYMKQPEGFVVRNEKNPVVPLYCKLKKSLYGLKQAGRNWYFTLTDKLLQLGFTKSKHDACLFYKVNGDNFTYACVWVDDIIICSNDLLGGLNFKKDMEKWFTISDFGELNWFLGMKIERESGVVKISTLNNRIVFTCHVLLTLKLIFF